MGHGTSELEVHEYSSFGRVDCEVGRGKRAKLCLAGLDNRHFKAHSIVQQTGTMPKSGSFYHCNLMCVADGSYVSFTVSFSHLRKFLPKAFLRSPSRAETPPSRLFIFLLWRSLYEAKHLSIVPFAPAIADMGGTACGYSGGVLAVDAGVGCARWTA